MRLQAPGTDWIAARPVTGPALIFSAPQSQSRRKGRKENAKILATAVALPTLVVLTIQKNSVSPRLCSSKFKKLCDPPILAG